MSESAVVGDDWMDLADAITLLRAQLAEAQRRIAVEGQDAGLLFELGEITVEFGMELTQTEGLNGGLRFSVVGLGGTREKAHKSTHAVTVKLNPHLPGGGDVDVSDVD